jgi:hypothetical protein
LRAVGHDRVDLDAAVHRSRMHHQRVGFCVGQLLQVEPEIMKVFLARRHERAVHALALQPQHHDDIGAVEALAHVAGHLDAHPLDAARQQRGGRDHAHPGAHGVEQQDIGARHARMHHVAADRNHQPLEPALVAANGQGIEQRLGRMFVGAVAGVDHGTVNLARQQLDRARGMVPDHQDVRVHGVQRRRGIDQGFALAHRGGGHRHVHDVGTEPFSCDFERGLGAGRGLEEQVDLGAAAQGGALFVDLAVELDIFLGEVEQAGNIGS